MQPRIEYKYLLTPAQARLVKSALLPHVYFDPFCLNFPDHKYPVSSIYFDSIDRLTFYEKLDGLQNRKKIRARYYYSSKSNLCSLFLEWKHKIGNITYKDRTKLTLLQYHQLSHQKFLAFMRNQSNFNKISVLEIMKNKLLPMTHIYFKREAFFAKNWPHLRINFDTQTQMKHNLNFSEFSSGVAILPSQIILEVKFLGKIPQWLHAIIVLYGLTHIAFSKYCLAVSSYDKLMESS